MKTIMQWVSLCAASLALTFLPNYAAAQTTPAIQGTFVADPAVPVLISPAPSGSGFFVLNQDFSLLQHSTVDISQNQSCDTGPGIYSRTNPAARTLVSDLYNAYFSGPDGPGLNTAVDALTPEVSCTPVTAFDYTGGLATQSVATNDPQHALYYLVSAFGGSQADQLLVLSNLNNATVSSTNKFTELNEAALDTNGVYTSIVADTRSDFGLTAITELKTATSPGNLWIYYPQTNAVYKILGPGGVPLPAVTSFIIPPQTDGGGSLLVLVNQDGLTTSNYLSPPQDTTPFTIIDLGQLRLLMGPNSAHNTITLPFVQQIKATTSFYAMLGAAYNPIDHRIYALVAGGTSVANIVENVISYDTLNPSAPGEMVVADASNITSALGTYPQIALNAASGTMQILTSNPAMVYTVGINGTGNNAVALTGSAFPDANFSPTFIAANPLQGETYIASSSGQVDILTRPTTKQGGLTITLTGSDLGYTSQEYDLKPLALWPVYDSSLGTAKLTITVTPKGGTPVVLATGHVVDIGYPGSSFYTYTFPAAGQYTIVATAEASANYPAVTSPPLNVFVGNTGVYPTAISLSVPATAPAVNGAATLNATVTLTGTTYAPLNAVYIQDQTGAEVGNVQLPKGAISNPIIIPITINQGVQTLTATYAGDEQNQSSTSAPQVITVGTVAKVTPTFAVTLPSTAVSGTSVAGNLKFTSSSTTAPTGTVTIYATLAGGTTSNQVATVPAAQAFASAGMSFSFTAPAAGTYSLFAGYGGDTNYSNAISPSVPLTVTAAALQTTTVGLVAPATATPGTAFNVVVGFNVFGAFTTQPTGNIVLTATSAGGTTTIATVTPAQGMAPGADSVSVNLPNAGVYTLNANYSGDSLYAASSNTATVTLNGFSTTVKVTAGASQTAGTAFTATIALTSTGSTLTPTGNVVLTAVPTTGPPTTLATVTAAQALATGGAAVSVTLPAAGTYTLTAAYSGSGAFSGSTGSAPVTVAAAPLISTVVGLVASTSTTAGTLFTANIFLTPDHAGSAAPTGNIVLSLSSSGNPTTTLATITAAQALQAGGFPVTASVVNKGIYTLTASYAGDANYAASGNTSSLTVNGLATTLAVTATASVQLQDPSGAANGTSGLVIIKLTKPASSAVPTGNIILTNTTAQGTVVTLGTVLASDAAGQFGVDTNFTPNVAGMNTITATYAGDSVFGPSTSSALVSVPQNITSLTLTGGVGGTAPANLTYALTLTGAFHPTGSVIVSATPNGGTAVPTNVLATQPAAAGGTSVVISFPAVGTYTLVARYAGDIDNTASASTVLTVVITGTGVPPSYTLTSDSTAPVDLQDGLTRSSTGITLTSFGGYNTAVNLATAIDPASNSIYTSIYNNAIKVIFQNHATGAQITSAVPTPTGTHIDVVFYYDTPTVKGQYTPERPGTNSSVYFAGGLFVFALYGLKRRGTRAALNLMMMMCVVAGSGLLFGGCALFDAIAPPQPATLCTSTIDVNGTTATAGDVAKVAKVVVNFLQYPGT